MYLPHHTHALTNDPDQVLVKINAAAIKSNRLQGSQSNVWASLWNWHVRDNSKEIGSKVAIETTDLQHGHVVFGAAAAGTSWQTLPLPTWPKLPKCPTGWNAIQSAALSVSHDTVLNGFF